MRVVVKLIDNYFLTNFKIGGEIKMSKKNGKKSELEIKLIMIVILGLIIMEIYLTATMGVFGLVMGLIIAFIILMIILAGTNRSKHTNVNAYLAHKNNEEKHKD